MDMIPVGHYKISQKLSSVGIYHSGLAGSWLAACLGCLLGLKISLGDWLTGGCLLGLKISLLAGVGTCMGSIGKQVPSLLHNHCATLAAAGTGTGASGSICI